MDLNDLIKNFVGKEIKLLITETKYKESVYTEYDVDPEDQVAKDLNTIVGDKLRILPPNTMTTCDYNPTRVNATVSATGEITNIYLG